MLACYFDPLRRASLSTNPNAFDDVWRCRKMEVSWNKGTPNHPSRLIRPFPYWNPWWLVPRPSGDGCVLGLAIAAGNPRWDASPESGCSLGFRSGDAKINGLLSMTTSWHQFLIWRFVLVFRHSLSTIYPGYPCVCLFISINKLHVLFAFAPMCFNLCVCSCLFFYVYPSTYLLFFHACIQPSIRPSCHPPIPISVYLHFSLLIMEKANFSCLSQHLWSWILILVAISDDNPPKSPRIHGNLP